MIWSRPLPITSPTWPMPVQQLKYLFLLLLLISGFLGIFYINYLIPSKRRRRWPHSKWLRTRKPKKRYYKNRKWSSRRRRRKKRNNNTCSLKNVSLGSYAERGRSLPPPTEETHIQLLLEMGEQQGNSVRENIN